jgi:phosphatidate cytidylyltransferase
MEFKKILIRTVSGAIYIGLILFAYFIGDKTFALLCSIFAIWSAIEFTKITSNQKLVSFSFFLDIMGILAVLYAFLIPKIGIPCWLLFIIARFIAQLYIKDEKPLYMLALSVMKQVYIGIGLGCMAAVASKFGNAVLAIFFMIWLNDTGAYLIGSTIGKHRLFERISPKKSWEGFFGGLIFDIVAAIIFCIFFNDFFNISQSIYAWICLAILVSVFSTWGDLLESLIKRSMHVKDAGESIPGHGGLLDRIDSILFVMPVSLMYLSILSGVF